MKPDGVGCFSMRLFFVFALSGRWYGAAPFVDQPNTPRSLDLASTQGCAAGDHPHSMNLE